MDLSCSLNHENWESQVIHRGWCDDLPMIGKDCCIGGDMGSQNEDFIVEEIPAYEPCGSGEHLYLWIEKSGKSTMEVAKAIQKAFDVKEILIGCAGKKDAKAITRQWISVQTPSDDEQPINKLNDLGWMRVLRVCRHTNKLRMGHLRGNFFTVSLYGTTSDDSIIENACQCIRLNGFINYFGKQRFGFDGGNVLEGLKVMDGKRVPHQMKLLYISAVQSAIFNLAAGRRYRDIGLDVRQGDVMQKIHAGCFICDDPQTDQTRQEHGEVAVTLSLPGSKLMNPTGFGLDLEETAARDFFQVWNQEFDNPRAPFDVRSLQAHGDRRVFVIQPEVLNFKRVEPNRIDCHFALPSGAYATVLLRHLCGPTFTR